MSRAKGDVAEAQAKQYLTALGFDIIESNVYLKGSELDIIAKKDAVLHFIEVKSAQSYELAVQNLTPKKLHRVIKGATQYMQKKQLNLDYVIDAVAVFNGECELIENITI